MGGTADAFYLIACAAACVAATAEPLYDVAFDLWFYDVHDGKAGAMYSHFTAFGVVQPNWSHSGYVILYASACLYAGQRLYRGTLGRKGIFAIWLLRSPRPSSSRRSARPPTSTPTTARTSCGSSTTPWSSACSKHPGVLFTVLAVHLWRRVETAWGLLGLFVVFPVTFFGANFGLGSPLIVALHLEDAHFSSGMVWGATFLTMAMCAIAVNGASKFLPSPIAVSEPETSAPEASLAQS